MSTIDDIDWTWWRVATVKNISLVLERNDWNNISLSLSVITLLLTFNGTRTLLKDDDFKYFYYIVKCKWWNKLNASLSEKYNLVSIASINPHFPHLKYLLDKHEIPHPSGTEKCKSDGMLFWFPLKHPLSYRTTHWRQAGYHHNTRELKFIYII